MSTAGALRLRRMEAEDIPFGMELKASVRWNQTEEDWKLFLEDRPEGCFVATWSGEPAGTVTTLDYDGAIGWISLLLVAPRYRRRGVGRALLEAALESLREVETVKLDATPEGRKVYESMGFEAEYDLERWVRPAGAFTASEARSAPDLPRPVTREDLEPIAARDVEVFGRSRARVLERLFGRSPELALVTEGVSGHLKGYAFGRQGSERAHAGPIVATSRATAEALLKAFLEHAGERPSITDAHLHDAQWTELLAALGFVKERELTRMYRGPNRFPGEPRMQWATAGPELG